MTATQSAVAGVEAGTRQPMPGGVDPRIWARRSAVTRAEDRRRLWWVLPVLGVAVVVVAGLAVLHSGLFEARHRRVVGVTHGSTAAIWSAAGIGSSTPLIDIDPTAAAARIERLPWVEQAVVHRNWPDTVTVTVTEGIPVAVVGQGTEAVVVDGRGRVLGSAASVVGSSALPVLADTGPVPAPGHDLGAGMVPAVQVAAAVPPVLRMRVQAVAVTGTGDVDVTLTGGIEVQFGPADQLQAKFESLAAVLDDPQSAPTGPATVNVEDPGEPTVGPPSQVSPGQHGSA